MSSLMKGHTWKKHSHKMTYPCIVEAKVDEVRLHVRLRGDAVEFLSYAGKPLYNLERYADNFRNLLPRFGLTELDLGVWVNRSFDATFRYVRSKRVPDDLKDADIEFLLFDAPELGTPYYERSWTLDTIATSASTLHSLTMLRPDWGVANSPEVVALIYERYREQGYEGVMVKSQDHVYERGKRSYGWLKYKPEEDADGIITALHEAIAGTDQPELGIKAGDRLGRIGSVTVRVVGDDGEVSEAAPHGIAHDLGREMLANPEAYIGRWCEFKYMERDRQGGYRHPTFHRLREEKE